MLRTLEYLDIRILSSLLECSCKDLIHLASDAPRLYHEIEIKKNNKSRIIEIPASNLKKKQKALLIKVLYHLKTHPRLYGGPGSSIKKAVAGHVQKPIIITMDIKDFFPSVKSPSIREMLRRHKGRKEVVEILTRLITYKDHLPHGAPTSPCFGRLILDPLAINLEKMLRGIHPNALFSIYVDDIIISGPLGIKRAIPTIYKMINRFEFDVNIEKTKVMEHNEEQVSLNIRLNNRIEPTKKYLKEVEELSRSVSSSDPKLRGKKVFIAFLFKGED